jgi:hypothetical protein
VCAYGFAFYLFFFVVVLLVGMVPALPFYTCKENARLHVRAT